ncbi:MAG: hypothetical protein QM696_07380 [Steroidobacteraceae bacterium]
MKISIIGAAGVMGSCAAFDLIVHRLPGELVMIDSWASMLKSHWMDLATVGSEYGVRVRSGTYEDMAGSGIVINMAGAPTGAVAARSEMLPANLPLIEQHAAAVNQHCPDAIVLTATNPVDPLNYAMYLLSRNRDRRRILGYSLNDSVRFRMWAAQALGVEATRVQGTVIGEHGHSQVMLFSTLRLDGKPVEIDAETKARIRARPPQMLHEFESLVPKRTAGWTSAIGVTTTVRAIVQDSKAVIPTNVVLDGEYGGRAMSMTVPAVIGKDGMERIIELELSPEEQEGVLATRRALDPHMRFVETHLKHPKAG